jgi:hypothetical protein
MVLLVSSQHAWLPHSNTSILWEGARRKTYEVGGVLGRESIGGEQGAVLALLAWCALRMLHVLCHTD